MRIVLDDFFHLLISRRCAMVEWFEYLTLLQRGLRFESHLDHDWKTRSARTVNYHRNAYLFDQVCVTEHPGFSLTCSQTHKDT